MCSSEKFIAPSLLSADFLHLENEIKLIEEGGCHLIHCDIMDGKFVPNLTFGPMIVKAVRKITNLPIDVHLMIKNPENFIDEFIDAGASYISVHIEGNDHCDRLINQIKNKNVKAGIVINPSTPVLMIKELINIVDFVLIMSVNPGFGGQSFIDYTKSKITELVELRKLIRNQFKIEIDGGVNLDNVEELSRLGVDIFVAGSAIFNAEDIKRRINEFSELIFRGYNE
ncbi:MAG TPA: ribulose-phosphate 3-epimerase [Melioribacteraceae bacterium]|nr:ribulose-phosphate 3-epimerase [Melioribacteraceae bacterium]